MNIALINSLTTAELLDLQAELTRDAIAGTLPWHGDPTGDIAREVLTYVTLLLNH